MIQAKMAILCFLEIKVFWKKGYTAIIFVHAVTKKISSRDWNNIVDAAMWSKFGISSVSMREVTITSILQEFDQNLAFFEEWSWFILNNLELGLLGMALKFYTSVTKRLKLRVRMFWWLIFTFVEVMLQGKNWLWGLFCHSPSSAPFPLCWIGLNQN